MFIYLSFLSCLFATNYDALTPVAHFKVPSDIILEVPFSMCFSENGELFMIDRNACKIHHWDAEQQYLGSFGEKGNGPGEFTYPARIVLEDGLVWVLEHLGQKMYAFDKSGRLVRTLHVTEQIAAFAIVGHHLYTAFFRQSGVRELVFRHRDHRRLAGPWQTLKSFPDRRYPKPSVMRAFAPYPDFQKGSDDVWYLGYSETTELIRIDRQGMVLGSDVFEIPSAMLTAEEIDWLKSLHMPAFSIPPIPYDKPSRRIDYSWPKSFYTQFLIKNNRVAFVSTVSGGYFGAGNGYGRATYSVCDLDTKKMVGKGRYQLPEDSVVLYRNGRILVAEINEQDDWDLWEAHLRFLD